MSLKAVTLYASTLASLAKSDAEFSEWVQGLKGLKEVIDNRPEVKKILSSPIIKVEDKMSLLKKILNGNFNSIISQFLFVLLEKRRWSLLDDIMKALNDEEKARAHVLELDIFVNDTLSPDAKEKITKQLENKYDKKVFLNEKIDPSLIGGAVILSQNTLIDCSMIERLEQMKIDLKEKV